MISTPPFFREVKMIPISTKSSERHSKNGAAVPEPDCGNKSVAQQPIHPAPTRRPTLLARVGKYTLIVAGLCAAVGGIEGALTGAMLAPSKDAGTLIMAVAIDRGILLGLVGGAIGAAIGAFDWCVGNRKKKVKN
jgi:hypothetical protein